jgi:phage terminase large subunit-like protein
VPPPAAPTASVVEPPPPPPARPTGKYERLSYERNERELKLAYGDRWNDPTIYGDPSASKHPRGFWFDDAAADRAQQFIEHYCRHHKGEWAGRPFILSPHQRFIVRCVFGWMRTDGTRRYRIAWVEVPRKDGKSELGGAIGNYLTIADDEAGAEVYSTATKEDQAKIVWAAAREMVKQSPDLRRFVVPRQKTLSCARLNSFFRPLGADSQTLDGLNPHGHVSDEIHAHKNRGLWDVMITAMGARRQPLTFAITTAGVFDPVSIGWELHDYAIQVLEGIIEDDFFFAIIFAADEGDDWRDPQTWAKANPNLGVSIKASYLAEQCAAAEKRPSFLNTFQRLHLNIWTQQITRWIPIEKWNACDATPLDLAQLKGRLGYGGLDLSTKLDITALTLVLPRENGWYDLLFRFWVPHQRVLERAQGGKKPDYATWVREGFLLETPGDVIDYEFIRQEVIALSKVLTIKQLAYDPWSATQLATQLQGDGFTMVETRQGMKTLSEPCKEFEKLVVSGRLRHGGNPVMRWMVDNVAVRKDANDNIAPDKRTAAGKIDGVVSTVMALGRAIVEPPPKASVYETRGVRSF